MVAMLPGFPAGIECVVRGKVCVPSVLRLSRGEFEVVVWEGKSEWRLRVGDDDDDVDGSGDNMKGDKEINANCDHRKEEDINDMMIDDGGIDTTKQTNEIYNNRNEIYTTNTNNITIHHHPSKPTNQTLLSAIQLPRFYPFHLIGFLLDVIQIRGNDCIFIRQPQRDEIAQISAPPLLFLSPAGIPRQNNALFI